jgi:predicted nucleotidyltransferase
MGETFSNFAEVKFLDRDQVIRDLQQAVAAAKAARPEILRVFLFGSFVQGNWTADSDADLIVVVRRSFPDLLSRSPYQIFTRAIPTDSLVYSEREFEDLSKDPTSFLAQNLLTAVEL